MDKQQSPLPTPMKLHHLLPPWTCPQWASSWLERCITHEEHVGGHTKSLQSCHKYKWLNIGSMHRATGRAMPGLNGQGCQGRTWTLVIRKTLLWPLLSHYPHLCLLGWTIPSSETQFFHLGNERGYQFKQVMWRQNLLGSCGKPPELTVVWASNLPLVWCAYVCVCTCMWEMSSFSNVSKCWLNTGWVKKRCLWDEFTGGEGS